MVKRFTKGISAAVCTAMLITSTMPNIALSDKAKAQEQSFKQVYPIEVSDISSVRKTVAHTDQTLIPLIEAVKASTSSAVKSTEVPSVSTSSSVTGTTVTKEPEKEEERTGDETAYFRVNVTHPSYIALQMTAEDAESTAVYLGEDTNEDGERVMRQSGTGKKTYFSLFEAGTYYGKAVVKGVNNNTEVKVGLQYQRVPEDIRIPALNGASGVQVNNGVETSGYVSKQKRSETYAFELGNDGDLVLTTTAKIPVEWKSGDIDVKLYNSVGSQIAKKTIVGPATLPAVDVTGNARNSMTNQITMKDLKQGKYYATVTAKNDPDNSAYVYETSMRADFTGVMNPASYPITWNLDSPVVKKTNKQKKTISGTCVTGASVYVGVNGATIEAVTDGSKWKAAADSELKNDTTFSVYATTPNSKSETRTYKVWQFEKKKPVIELKGNKISKKEYKKLKKKDKAEKKKTKKEKIGTAKKVTLNKKAKSKKDTSSKDSNSKDKKSKKNKKNKNKMKFFKGNVKAKIYDEDSGIKSVTVNGKNIKLKKIKKALKFKKAGKYKITAVDRAGNIKKVKFKIYKKKSAKKKSAKKKNKK